MSRTHVWALLACIAITLWLMAGCDSGGSKARITLGLEPGTLDLVAGQEIQLSPTVTRNGKPMANPQLTWQVDGAIGAITETGLFTATTTVTSDAPKSGTITVTGYRKSVTIPVTVRVGSLARIVIIPPEGVNLARVPLGTQLTFRAVGEDAFGNRGQTRITVNPTWSVEGGIGTISPAGVFTATGAGTGTVVATVAGVAPASASVSVTVVSDDPAARRLRIVPPANFGADSVLIGDQVLFSAIITDGAGNPVDEQPVGLTWGVTGDVGNIAPNGQFTATAIGNGAITAQAGPLSDTLPIRVISPMLGGKIAFVYGTPTNSNLGLAEAGGALTKLTTGRNMYTGPCFSADGTQLLCMSQNAAYQGVCVMTRGGAVRAIYASRGQDPAWSPDGTKIAFSNGKYAGGEIVLITSTGTYLGKIAAGLTGTPSDPCWSSDGSKIAFCIDSDGNFADGVYLTKADGTGLPERIYQGDATHIAWSAQAGKIAVADGQEIALLDPATKAVQVLMHSNKQLVGGLAWSPDGSAVAYAVHDGTFTSIYACFVRSGRSVTLFSMPETSVFDPSWTD